MQCALEISKAVGQAFLPARSEARQAGALALQLRMGIHSGPVSGVVDVSGRANIAGAGINLAQRVMDAAMPGTSFFPNTSPKTWNSTASGNVIYTSLATRK